MKPALKEPGGPKPDLAWLLVQRCHVDRRYQRQIDSRRSQELIERIARDFRWAAFSAVLAAPDGKGGYLILDGQHRVEAARRVGIARVPAVVVETASVAEQALAFVRANQDRVIVSPYALYHARLVAGDEEAKAVDQLCSRAAIVIPRYPVQHKNMKPGETMALYTIVRLRRLFGEDVTLLALKAVARGWDRHAGDLRSSVIKAAAMVIADADPSARLKLGRADQRAPAGQSKPEAVAARLMRHLALTPPRELARAMRRKRESLQGTEAQAYEAVLRRALEMPVVEATVRRAQDSEAGLPARGLSPRAAPGTDADLPSAIAGEARLTTGRSSIASAIVAERPASKNPRPLTHERSIAKIDPQLEREMIDAHLRNKGVTKCPPAYAAPVTGARPAGPLPHADGETCFSKTRKGQARRRAGQ